MAGRDSAEHLAEKTNRRGGNLSRLGPAGLRIAHLGEEERQIALLHLSRPMAGKEGIEMLSRAAKWLARQLHVLPQSVRVRSRDGLQELLVELIAVASDPRHEDG